MPDQPSRRQRRFARRRQEILDVAARFFAQKGYADTTISELAEALDMADGTLYNYFPGKRDILIAILEQATAGAEEMLAGVGEVRTRDDLVALLAQMYGVFMTHLPFTRTLLAEAWADDQVLREYAADHLAYLAKGAHAFIAARVEAGTFRPVDPELAAQMALGLFFAPLVPTLRGITPPPSPEQRRAIAETAVDLLLDGIRVRREERQ